MNDLTISRLAGASNSPAASHSALSASGAHPAAPASARQMNAKAAASFREFEAVFLQNFVEAMLPDQAESLFGKGLAGDTWKSYLAEKVAEKLAQSGQIGLADMLASASVRNASARP